MYQLPHKQVQPQMNPFHHTGMHDHMHQPPQQMPREPSGYAMNPALFPVNMENVARSLESIQTTREYNVRYPPGHKRYQGLP